MKFLEIKPVKVYNIHSYIFLFPAIPLLLPNIMSKTSPSSDHITIDLNFAIGISEGWLDTHITI